LDHGKPRGPQQTRLETAAIDLGNEPPLSVDGGAGGVIDRRRISAHWFSATILTAVCGAALMGGAVFASLDGQTTFAALPERLESGLRGTLSSERPSLSRKGDRLPPPGEANAVRQIIRVSTTSRLGEREVVRVRPFVRVSANLALTASELTANLGPFNAQKLVALDNSEGTSAPDEAPGAESDAEVSFVTRDLASLLPRIKLAAALSGDEILNRVRDIASLNGNFKPRFALPNTEASKLLAYAAEGDADPFAGFRGRIFPENISLLPKTVQTPAGNGWNERAVAAKKGESVGSILRELGATPDEIKAITSALGSRGRDGALREGQKLRILLAATGVPQRLQPARVIISNESVVEAVVALSDKGKYVAVDVQRMNAEAAERKEADTDIAGIRLYQSLYETGLRNQLPPSVIEGMLRIFHYDVDFQQKVQPGDSFDLLYAGEEEPANNDGKAEVWFASLTIGGETKKYYRFQTTDDGVVDFYDETGKSTKKFLLRKPLASGELRSGFGARNHPILSVYKEHTGVDWSAPLGTPIYAAGNGVITKVGWESGYGKYIRIRHANGYETAYGHMTAFARSSVEGARVRQGQVIGYVGSTGLSTGPHLHYEILVNGRFVDPMRLKLPRGRALENAELAAFEQERERLDAMMRRADTQVAQPSTGLRTAGRAQADRSSRRRGELTVEGQSLARR